MCINCHIGGRSAAHAEVFFYCSPFPLGFNKDARILKRIKCIPSLLLDPNLISKAIEPNRSPDNHVPCLIKNVKDILDVLLL